MRLYHFLIYRHLTREPPFGKTRRSAAHIISSLTWWKTWSIIAQNFSATMVSSPSLNGTRRTRVRRSMHAFRHHFCTIDEILGKIRRLCMLSANLSELAKGRRFISPTGQSYFQAHFNAELSFGTTEMKARITWTGTDVRFFLLLTLNSVVNFIA